MKTFIMILLTARAHAVEFEFTDKITVTNAATFKGTATVEGNAFSVGGSTLTVAAGKVGIGTTNPSTGRLEVRQSADDDDSGIGVLSLDGVSRALRLWAGNDTTARIESGNGGTGTLVLNSGGGKVGVGTASPQGLLHLVQASGNMSVVLESTETDAFSTIELRGAGNGGPFIDFATGSTGSNTPDYSARIQRNGGANSSLAFNQTGTGGFLFSGGALSTGNGGIRWKVLTGTTDGSGNISLAHGLSDISKIVSISARVYVNNVYMRDPVDDGGNLYADSTNVIIDGSLAGNWAGRTANILLVYTE